MSPQPHAGPQNTAIAPAETTPRRREITPELHELFKRTAKVCARRAAMEANPRPTTGHEVILDDDSDLGYGPPAVFVRRADEGAELGFYYGPGETITWVSHDMLRRLLAGITAVLGQLFKPGEYQVVDKLLNRKAGDRSRRGGRRPHEIRLGRDGLLILTLQRYEDGSIFPGAVLKVVTGPTLIEIELGAYEVLDLHDAVRDVLAEIATDEESVQA